ncbi:MAG: TrmH family RNA methyltransferase [Candidatus Dormibacteraceae bacterium]
MPITSSDNPLVRRLRAMGRRREPGRVLLEGPRVLKEAIACSVHLELLVAREGSELDFEAPADRVAVLSGRVFDATAQTVTPQGVLAIACHDTVSAEQAVEAARRARWPLLVLDGVQDPGNVGAICRSAAGAGAPALMVLDGSADPLSARAVRASAGNLFRVQLGRGSWADLGPLSGFGATAEGGVDLLEADLRGAAVIAFGSEGRGLRRSDLQPLSIKMAPGVDSLNVAAAAALIIYEVARRW